MGSVSIIKIKNTIREGLEKALELIGGLSRFVGQNERIMLKPNINGTDVITKPALLEAIIQMLLDYGIKSISIGESSFGNARITDAYFNRTGYTHLAETYRIPLINLNRSEARSITVKRPLVLNTINIAQDVFHIDKLINLPVMKVHYATGITCALKNLKGILQCGEKKHFHEVGLDKAIVDLNNTIKPNLTIVDGTSCMERMGPHGGDIVTLNLLLAGRHSWEVDCIGCQVMGYGIDEVRHLRYYLESNNITNEQTGSIKVCGNTIEDVKHPFKKIHVERIIPPQWTIHQTNACSACMNAFLVSCMLLEHRTEKEAHVYIGSKHEEMCGTDGIRVIFGNCACDNFPPGKGDGGIFYLRGCPPYPFELKQRLGKIQSK
jgi:uncharacterized protein (DUF362 family)